MKTLIHFTLFLIASVLLTSCEVVGDIFGAGVYTGIFLVIGVVLLIVFLIMKMRKRD